MASLETTVSTKLGADPVITAAIEHDGRRLLEILAARNGRSLSAEARAALRSHITRALLSGVLTVESVRPERNTA